MNYRTRTQAAEETLAAERAKRIFDAAPEMLELLKRIYNTRALDSYDLIAEDVYDVLRKVEGQS